MMTGNGVMHNGTTILDEYGHNLDRLKASDISFFFFYISADTLCPPSSSHNAADLLLGGNSFYNP